MFYTKEANRAREGILKGYSPTEFVIECVYHTDKSLSIMTAVYESNPEWNGLSHTSESMIRSVDKKDVGSDEMVDLISVPTLDDVVALSRKLKKRDKEGDIRIASVLAIMKSKEFLQMQNNRFLGKPSNVHRKNRSMLEVFVPIFPELNALRFD